MYKISTRKDIQVFRGISVISVMLYHFDSNVFSFGYLGVDIFFIISGFVISNLIYSEIQQDKFSLKNFYFKRFKRIFPSLISFIIFVQILIYFFLDHQFIYQTSKVNFYSIFFISNIYLSQIIDYFNNSVPKNFVINLWSLSVEEQFYLIFPIFALFTKKLSNSKKFVLLIFTCFLSILFNFEDLFLSVSVFKKVFFTHSNFVFYSPFTRTWQFALGVIAMFLNQKLKNIKYKTNENFYTLIQILVLLLITLNFLRINEQLNLVFICSIFFIFLLIDSNLNEVNNKILKFLIFTGNISYSLYLFHQPIFAAIRNYNEYSISKFNIDFEIGNLVNILFLFFLIYLLSFFNFVNVENRFRYIKKFNFKELRLLSLFIIISSSLIFIGLNTNGYAFRDSEYASFNQTSKLEFVAGSNYLAKDSIQCIDKGSLSDSCVFNEGKKRNIYIIGDSIMSSLVSGFVENENLSNYSIIEVTAGGCPLLINQCGFTIDSILYNEIVNIENSIILIGGQYTKYFNSDNFEANLIYTVSKLAENNKVYFFNSFPNPGLNIRMYKQINGFLPELDVNNKDFKDPINLVFQKINIKNFNFIDTTEIFCDESVCKFYDNSNYYFLDHIHFSYYGAEEVSKYFIDKFLTELSSN